MKKQKKNVIKVSAREAALKRRLRRHLTSLGFRKAKNGLLEPPGSGKEAVRAVHKGHRADRLAANRRFIADRFPKLIGYFPDFRRIEYPVEPCCPQLTPGVCGKGSVWETDIEHGRKGIEDCRHEIVEVLLRVAS